MAQYAQFIILVFLLVTCVVLIQGQNQLVQYKVFGHPMSLVSLEVFEVDSPKHCLTLVERTQLHQRIKMYTLQTNNKEDRVSQLSIEWQTSLVVEMLH